MADPTYSPRLHEFTRRQKAAKENAKSVHDEVVAEMVGSVGEVTPSEDSADVETAEFDPIAGARKILRAPRVVNQEAAEQRALGRKERARRLQGERDQAKPSGAAASLVDLSPAKFKTALTSLFKELDVDQAHWLKEIAESAEKAAWEREADVPEPEPEPVRQRVKTRDEFEDDLSYDNYIAYLANVDGGGGKSDDDDYD